MLQFKFLPLKNIFIFQVCEELVDRCLAPDCELSGVGCDNMTVVLVCLLQGLSHSEYVERLKRESLATEDANLQNMLQDLKFDQNFMNNAGPFLLHQDAAHDSSINVLIGQSVGTSAQRNVEETPKQTDQYTTPSESPSERLVTNLITVRGIGFMRDFFEWDKQY